jgi:hypothetical protein
MMRFLQLGRFLGKFVRRRPVVALLIAVFGALGLWVGPMVRTLYRSTGQFVPWPAEPHVKYEPGAEAMAAEVVAALPGAILTVEEQLHQRFLLPPTVFVCATLTTYGSYGGSPTSGGYVINGRLFLSPKPANTSERIPRLLAHELTHLHVEQHIGMVRAMRLPFWFSEGLAVLVSSGGGAENTTEEEARRAIVEGRVFVPDGRVGLLGRKVPSSFGLPPHLFYREAAIFLGHVMQGDANRFRDFLQRVEDQRPIGTAFEAVYGETLTAAWDGFVATVKASSSS